MTIRALNSVTYEKADDVNYINYVLAYFTFQALNLFVKLVIIDFPYWTIISRGILAIFLLRAMMDFVKTNLKTFVIVESLALIGFGYTMLIGDYQREEFLSIVFNAIVVFLPLSFCIASISDYKKFMQKLYLAAWPIIVILSATSIHQTFSIYDYNMPLSYAILLQLLIVVDHFTETRKWYDFLLASLLVSLIVICGSRGPLLSFFFYLVLLIGFSKRLSTSKRLVLIFTILILIVITIAAMDRILLFLIGVLDEHDISSRTLYYLLEQNYSGTGRDVLYRLYINKAFHGPLFGFGIAGGWEDSYYPHNIFLEFFLSFGLIIGLLFAIVLIAIIIEGVKIKNVTKQRVALVFISYCSCLLVSNSFILEPVFFAMIPICLSDKRVVLKFGD